VEGLLLSYANMKARVSKPVRTVRQLLKGIGVGMLSTQTEQGETHTRPMLVQDVDGDGWLWFLTDRSSRKACELSKNPSANVVFQSPRGDRYVSVRGTAVVVHDGVKLKKVWNPTFRAWFPKGKRDPEIALIALKIASVDYWVVPRSRLVRVTGAARALLTGRRYEARHQTLNFAKA